MPSVEYLCGIGVAVITVVGVSLLAQASRGSQSRWQDGDRTG